MSQKHADLSPSSAERWIQCPASVRMSEGVTEGTPSVYAREGTAAHALGELMAQHQLLGMSASQYRARLGRWRREYADVVKDEAEMAGHCKMYVEYLRHITDSHPDAHLMLEQKVPTGLPNCWGTADAVIVSPTIIEIVDFKYGMGVAVEALGNPQLRLYGVGALGAFGDLLGEVELIRCTVYQPRLHHVLTEEISADELRAWRDSLIPIAEEALGPDAHFGPSEAACRWCPVSGRCKAQLEHFANLDFSTPIDTLSDEELSDILSRIPHIMAWCNAVRDYALNRVYSEQKPLPGWKVVMSGGRRSITDPEKALEALELIGYSLDQVSTRKIKGIGDLEKLLHADFDKALGPFITKGTGSPSLVPEDDSRRSVNPNDGAIKEFSDE